MQDCDFYEMDSSVFPVVKYINQVHVEPPHIHMRRQTEEFILYYILSGSMYLKEGNVSYLLKPRDVLILDPAFEHYGTRTSSCSYFYIHFYHSGLKRGRLSFDSLKKQVTEERLSALKTDECSIRSLPEQPVILPKYMNLENITTIAQIRELLERIKASHYEHLEHFQLFTSCQLTQLLLSLSRELADAFLYNEKASLADRCNQTIYDILVFIQNNYSEKITGNLIEEKFGYSYDYINRLFKKAVGSTIVEYLNRLRISKAQQMLSAGTFSIPETADKCGFSDVYYFSRVFKKVTGITPGDYSKKLIRNHSLIN